MQKAARATTRVVATGRGVGGVEVAQLFTRIASFGRRDVALDRAQLRVAVEHELDGLLVGGVEFLRDVRDLEVARHLERAGVRVKLAAHERHEARFAAAVLARDADLLAAKQAEGGSGEQQARPAAYRDVLK